MIIDWSSMDWMDRDELMEFAESLQEEINEMKSSIMKLLSLESSLENKLDLLTAIGITSTCEEVFGTCEEIRNEIVPDDPESTPKREDLLSGSKTHRISERDSGNEGADEVHGDK